MRFNEIRSERRQTVLVPPQQRRGLTGGAHKGGVELAKERQQPAPAVVYTQPAAWGNAPAVLPGTLPGELAAAALPGAASGNISAEASPVEAPRDYTSVNSPMVGMFYAAPAENADPFVSVGDRVEEGQTLCIIEAMKLMNEITAEEDGVITRVCAQNGQVVEYGSPLFQLRAGA